jgi:hypothetical protein
MAATAATLLRAWEAGAAEAPLDRAPSLLLLLGTVPAETSVDELSVGQCDARLFALRRAMFGEALEVVATCPSCRTEVELTVRLGDMQPPVLEAPDGPVNVTVDGYAVVCRIPRNADLRLAAAAGDRTTLRDLVDRCVLDARMPDGVPAGLGELPDAVVEAVAAAVAERDPGAQTTLRIRCPCGSDWSEDLDIRAVVWSDLTDWVGRTLLEVHQLAQAYGWSEAEIMSLPAWRRRWYLEAGGW